MAADGQRSAGPLCEGACTPSHRAGKPAATHLRVAACLCNDQAVSMRLPGQGGCASLQSGAASGSFSQGGPSLPSTLGLSCLQRLEHARPACTPLHAHAAQDLRDMLGPSQCGQRPQRSAARGAHPPPGSWPPAWPCACPAASAWASSEASGAGSRAACSLRLTKGRCRSAASQPAQVECLLGQARLQVGVNLDPWLGTACTSRMPLQQGSHPAFRMVMSAMGPAARRLSPATPSVRLLRHGRPTCKAMQAGTHRQDALVGGPVQVGNRARHLWLVAPLAQAHRVQRLALSLAGPQAIHGHLACTSRPQGLGSTNILPKHAPAGPMARQQELVPDTAHQVAQTSVSDSGSCEESPHMLRQERRASSRLRGANFCPGPARPAAQTEKPYVPAIRP